LASQLEDGRLRQRIDERGKPARMVTRVDGDAFNALWLDTVSKPTAWSAATSD